MSAQPKISVLIPLWRGRPTIKNCLDSLLVQEGVGIEILLLDNGCPEDTGEWAGYYLAQEKPGVPWRLFEEPVNIGFAAGMNRLYSESKYPYILFINQDVTLAPDHLRVLYEALEAHKDWAGVCGTLFRTENREGRNVIDTTGHEIFRDRIVRNRGAGKAVEKDKEFPYPAGEVFGLSAACAMYRREALESAREEEGPFDPDFFAYFEDVDLDYRIHRSGGKLGYVPEAVGNHALAGSGGRRELKIRLRAYGNRRRILLKHESFQSLTPDLIPILAQDTYGVIRALITDPAACIAGPIIMWSGLGSISKRKKRCDELWGSDRKWIRKWLKPWRERFVG